MFMFKLLAALSLIGLVVKLPESVFWVKSFSGVVFILSCIALSLDYLSKRRKLS